MFDREKARGFVVDLRTLYHLLELVQLARAFQSGQDDQPVLRRKTCETMRDPLVELSGRVDLDDALWQEIACRLARKRNLTIAWGGNQEEHMKCVEAAKHTFTKALDEDDLKGFGNTVLGLLKTARGSLKNLGVKTAKQLPIPPEDWSEVDPLMDKLEAEVLAKEEPPAEDTEAAIVGGHTVIAVKLPGRDVFLEGLEHKLPKPVVQWVRYGGHVAANLRGYTREDFVRQFRETIKPMLAPEYGGLTRVVEAMMDESQMIDFSFGLEGIRRQLAALPAKAWHDERGAPQEDAERSAGPEAAPGGVEPKQKGKRPGRPPLDERERKRRQRIFDAWGSKAYKDYSEIAREMRIEYKDVKTAVEYVAKQKWGVGARKK